jgi:hypothetical protein
MPPGKGRTSLRVSIPTELREYLDKEAAYRKTTVQQLTLDSLDHFLHPERQERGALRDQLDVTRDELAKVLPLFEQVERIGARGERLDRELIDLRHEIRQSLAGVESAVTAMRETRRQQRIRRYVIGGCALGFAAVLAWTFPGAPVLAGSVALLALMFVLLP